MDPSDSGPHRRQPLAANRPWRVLAVLALIPCLTSSYLMVSGWIHLIDPAAVMPPGTSHGAVEAIPLAGWVLGGLALAAYWTAYVLLWKRSRYFALPYTVAALARISAWILMIFNPEFPQMPGFALLGVDSAVLLVAMSWRTQLSQSKQAG